MDKSNARVELWIVRRQNIAHAPESTLEEWGVEWVSNRKYGTRSLGNQQDSTSRRGWVALQQWMDHLWSPSGERCDGGARPRSPATSE
jgi:hypothetical protein